MEDNRKVNVDQNEEIKDQHDIEAEANECCEELKESAEETPKKKSIFKKKEDKEADTIRDLEKQILELNEKLAAAKNEYFKAYADAENMKKRLKKDYDMMNKYHIQSFATDILPAIDNLERALDNAEKDSPIYVGVNMVLQQILNSLKGEGVEEIEAEGLAFDANVHHAIMAEKREGVEPNQVIEVLQKGYKLKDRILRASLVKVSE